jgi:heme-degrading monooxygenase HmoA
VISYKRGRYIPCLGEDTLVLARLSVWHFKKGQRKDAFSELDGILNTLTRNTRGFRGYMSLLSQDDPNAATILTLWQDEECLEASEKDVFAGAVDKVHSSLESPPHLERLRVFSTELLQRSE